MLPQEIIRAKRDGERLDDDAIRAFVAGITDGRVGDEQLGAFAMAVFLNGMDRAETARLTLAMRDSGSVLDFSGAGLDGSMLDGPVLDKHSTGGVGDSVSLILGPWVAACGGYVPMISGQGLGHTGGTLDKLSAIPGYDPFPGRARLSAVVADVGVAIIGQTDDLAPADRRFYAVRDVTATVECIPLIVASILSKKLAEGLDALVMDVKTGSGSVMGEPARCLELARAIVEVAGRAGTPTSALVTDMNQVLGRNAGNALEVIEAVEVLRGERRDSRLLDVTRELAAEMLIAGGLHGDRDDALTALDRALASGAAAERFSRMVAALGGPADLVDRPEVSLPRAAVAIDIAPAHDGYVEAMDVREIGMAVVGLGGGRHRGGQAVDYSVGLENVAGIGEHVDRDRPLARVHAASDTDADRAAGRIRRAVRIADRPTTPPPRVLTTFRAGDLDFESADKRR
ncbi:MAG: thymidine phosphorylase [Wenzhouxiangellaceae bacterium]|nr:thymidine phosphorylase [Wenzhouxiangellaceae bacterium]